MSYEFGLSRCTMLYSEDLLAQTYEYLLSLTGLVSFVVP